MVLNDAIVSQYLPTVRCKSGTWGAEPIASHTPWSTQSDDILTNTCTNTTSESATETPTQIMNWQSELQVKQQGQLCDVPPKTFVDKTPQEHQTDPNLQLSHSDQECKFSRKMWAVPSPTICNRTGGKCTDRFIAANYRLIDLTNRKAIFFSSQPPHSPLPILNNRLLKLNSDACSFKGKWIFQQPRAEQRLVLTTFMVKFDLKDPIEPNRIFKRPKSVCQGAPFSFSPSSKFINTFLKKCRACKLHQLSW